MKNLDLNAYEVSEMNHQEMMEIDGGGLLTGLLIGAAILLLTSCGSKDSHGKNNAAITIIDEGKGNVVILNGDTIKK